MATATRVPATLTAALALSLALPATLPGAGLASGNKGARGAHARAHAATAPYMTGLGDEQAEMFNDPLWQQLHTRIARYIAPYDAVAHPDSLRKATAWITAAEEAHVKILVAFYHSQHTPTVLPSYALYKHYVQKFVKRFPNVRQYQSWDEANRGNVPGLFSSPSPKAAAQYYQALIRVCKGCTAVGLDVLDQEKIGRTLNYIKEFKSEIGHLQTVMPRIWGLHDYSDVNRRESWRTRQLSRTMGGQIWLTETGGIVKFGGAFPFSGGFGLTRAASVIKYTFGLAASQSSRIKRVYIYNWTGGSSSSRFDAGLTDNHHRPRAGYVVVCRHLNAHKCSLRVSHH
ncbi:MAG: hypothetical protein E6G34_09325 [Actinobacteria bacterium]|nr:MAG: hypothetical protein E6G34_09325 [Actinomycetota bacterium]